jgi:hypothetical protein
MKEIGIDGEKLKLLLHVCCGPCSVYTAPLLREKYDVTCFFFNPNVDDPAEYEKRRSQMALLPGFEGIEILYGPYDMDLWRQQVKGLEAEPEGGERCRKCFLMRLGETARTGREMGFDLFATTLTVAPMKNAALVNEAGLEAARREGIEYLPSDFKKKDGYRKSVELSRMAGIYRQDFCGCSFSRRPGRGGNGGKI